MKEIGFIDSVFTVLKATQLPNESMIFLGDSTRYLLARDQLKKSANTLNGAIFTKNIKMLVIAYTATAVVLKIYKTH